MPIPLLPIVLGLLAYAATREETPAPAASTPTGPGAGGPMTPAAANNLLGTTVDARGVLAWRPDVAAILMGQLAGKSALGAGDQRTIGDQGQGENAAAWVAARAAMGKVVCVSATGEQPGKLLALEAGQEVHYAQASKAQWAVLAWPYGAQSGPVGPATAPGSTTPPGGLPGAPAGFPGFPGFPGMPNIPTTPGQLPGGLPGGAVPTTPAAEDATPIVVDGGVQYVRADVVPLVNGELATKRLVLVQGGQGFEVWTQPALGTPETASAHGLSWLLERVQKGEWVLMRKRPYPPGVNGDLLVTSQWPIVASVAQVGGAYAVLAKPLTVFQQPGAPAVPSMPGFPPPPPGVVPQAPAPTLPGSLPPQTAPAQDPIDALPAAVKQQVVTAAASGDPGKVEQMANAIRGQYPAAGAQLDKAAADMRTQAKLTAIAAGRMYVIRQGDNPSKMAEWYTGQASRYGELLKLNGIRLVPSPNDPAIKWPDPQRWYPGAEVELPGTWNVSKGLPPVVRGKAKTSAKVAPPPPPPPPDPTPSRGDPIAAVPGSDHLPEALKPPKKAKRS
jgi:hypothetical protein